MRCDAFILLLELCKHPKLSTHHQSLGWRVPWEPIWTVPNMSHGASTMFLPFGDPLERKGTNYLLWKTKPAKEKRHIG